MEEESTPFPHFECDLGHSSSVIICKWQSDVSENENNFLFYHCGIMEGNDIKIYAKYLYRIEYKMVFLVTFLVVKKFKCSTNLGFQFDRIITAKFEG